MKKIFAILLAVTMLASMATVASAAETTKSTTLTTEVPAATYTLNIPVDQEIPFGATKTSIGNITVTDAENFAEGKNLKVTLTYDPFKSDDVATTIPFVIRPGLAAAIGGEIPTLTSGKQVTFRGEEDGTVTEKSGIPLTNGNYVDISTLYVEVDSTDWGKALAGEYTSTITFTAEVVVEE